MANPNVQAGVETITPEVASALLRSMKSQRKPMLSHVDFLAGQIAAGKWGLNGQSLIVSTDGGLLDGQHRCMAVIRAGRPIRSVVVRGIDADQFATMDTGVVRMATHVLQIRGRTDCNNLAANLRLLANYRDGRYSGTPSRVTNQRILDLDEANADVSDSVKWAHNAYHAMRVGHVWKIPAAAFARHFVMQLAPKHAERFCRAVVTGEGPSYGWPTVGALALRERLARAYKDHERPALQEVLASFVLAWNSRGRSVTWKDLVWRRPKPSEKNPAPMPRFDVKSSEEAA